jgi:hypothetical protein
MSRSEITARSPLEGLMTPLAEGALTVEPKDYLPAGDVGAKHRL